MARRSQLLALASLLVLAMGSRVELEVEKLDTDAEEEGANPTSTEESVHVAKLSFQQEGAGQVEDDVTVFNNNEIAAGMGAPDPSFPEHLRYIVWMDQAGQYAKSTGVFPKGALPDALVLIAQQGRVIGADNWQTIGTCNKGWSWFWGEEGKEEYRKLRAKKGACHNMVYWSDEARTTGRFHGLFNADPTSFVEKYLTKIGFTLMPWWNCKLNGLQCEEAAKVKCPPEKESERHHCAMWQRWNYAAGFVSLGTYYAFPVVDSHGKPVEPYFTAFQEAMKSNKYSPKQQFVGNMDHPDWD